MTYLDTKESELLEPVWTEKQAESEKRVDRVVTATLVFISALLFVAFCFTLAADAAPHGAEDVVCTEPDGCIAYYIDPNGRPFPVRFKMDDHLEAEDPFFVMPGDGWKVVDKDGLPPLP